MIPSLTDGQKRYRAAQERFLQPALMRFVAQEFPHIGGPLVVKLFVEKILERIDRLAPLRHRVQPGQLVWNALDQTTRADHPRRKTKSVTLTLVTAGEINQLESGVRSATIMPERIARLCREAYAHGALLSMRDLGIIFGKHGATLSHYRIAYEQQKQTVLPHTGSLHDQGTTLTHKAIICRKVKLEKKDPSVVARETNHSQRAVDNYLQGYERVKALKELRKSSKEISFLTGMGNHLVHQYEQLIQELEPAKVELST